MEKKMWNLVVKNADFICGITVEEIRHSGQPLNLPPSKKIPNGSLYSIKLKPDVYDIVITESGNQKIYENVHIHSDKDTPLEVSQVTWLTK